MLKISREFVKQVQAAEAPEDLHEPIQNAIALELATIPPYLCALFTLKPGADPALAPIISDIALDEMLHMNIVCNLKIALKGSPNITAAAAGLRYPGPLPMNIGNSFKVHLRKCSIVQIEDVFMKIEEPQDPIVFKAFAPPEHATIGEFYHELVSKIETLGNGAFDPDVSKQVIVRAFGSDVMFPITNVATAKKAILEVIVRQGEGTAVSPQFEEGQFAHYYRFQQIVKERRLKKIETAPYWSFSGDPIKIAPDKVWDMDEDPTTAEYAGTPAEAAVAEFNRLYSSMLRSLDKAFKGDPAGMREARGAMGALPMAAEKVLAIPSPRGTGTQAGLPFDYVP